MKLIRILILVASLALSINPSISFADNVKDCRITDVNWSQLSLAFPVKKERLKYVPRAKVLVIPFHPSDAPSFSLSSAEKASFLQSADDIKKLSSGLSEIEFIFNPTIKLEMNTSELDKFKINARQTYLKDFENDQFGFALKFIEEADQTVDYTGIDSVVLYGVSKQSKEEIASALQYTEDLNFIGNWNKRKDGKPWFMPIVTNERIISNVVLMYNNSGAFVITHELLHNYGLTDLYGHDQAPFGLSRMDSSVETLLTYEKWILGWHPEQDVRCVSGGKSREINRFDFDIKNKEQLAMVRPNQTSQVQSLYVAETLFRNNKPVLSFYKVADDGRKIDYYSSILGRAGVELNDSSAIASIYQGDEYSLLIHSIADSLATVYLYSNSLATSQDVQRLISEAKANAEAEAKAKAKAAAELKAKQEVEAKVAAELKAKAEEATIIESKRLGTYYEDSSGCHIENLVATLQSNSSGNWTDVAIARGWLRPPGCPANNPVKPWTVYMPTPGEMLRWRIQFPGSVAYTNPFVETTTKYLENLELMKAAAELKAKQEAEAKAAAELKAKQEAEAKAAADNAVLAKAQSELVAANAALADAQKVNREQAARISSFEEQYKVLSESVTSLQNQLSQLNSKLTAALSSLNTANAKIKKICSAKPKPKGC